MIRLFPLRFLTCLVFCVVVSSPPLLKSLHAKASLKYMSATVDGVQMKLVIPSSYCLMNNQNPADKMALTALSKGLAGRNELLGHYSDCDELSSWRSGKASALNHKGTYQVSVKLKDVDLTGREVATVKNVCKFISAKGPKFSDAAHSLKTGFDQIPLNQGKKLGVAHEEDNLCIAASVLRLENLDKTTRGQISLYATSVIKGRLLYSYLYSSGNKIEDINTLTKKMIEIHNLNVQANQ